MQAQRLAKTLHIHIGPHHGGPSVADALRNETKALQRDFNLTVMDDAPARAAAAFLADENTKDAVTALQSMAQEIDEAPGACVLSCVDLGGEILGGSGKKRAYPRWARNLGLIARALEPCQVVFYAVLPDRDAYVDHAYAQHLRHRTRFSTRAAFAGFYLIDDLWDGVLQKSRDKFGAQLVECSAASVPLSDFLTAVTGQSFAPSTPQVLAQASSHQPLFEMINGGSASAHAKQGAKAFLEQPPRARAPLETPPVWPPASPRPAWLAPALNPLWGRVEKRVSAQDQPNLMPDMAADLTPYRVRLVSAPDAFPTGGRGAMDNQLRILAYRFRGLPETCLLHGLTISYLRRETGHSAHAAQLFQRLWAQEHALLLGTLPTRWLISAFQTFMDHGANEGQRSAGAAAYFMANTLKLYEAERAIEGRAPDATYPGTKPQTRQGFRGLDRFDVGGSDLMVNTNALLLELASRDDVSGRVVQEFMLRMKRANTAFSRMDHNRVAHNATQTQFTNCWSFFVPPKSV